MIVVSGHGWREEWGAALKLKREGKFWPTTIFKSVKPWSGEDREAGISCFAKIAMPAIWVGREKRIPGGTYGGKYVCAR